MAKEKSVEISKISQLKLYLEESKEELKKVVWPEKKVVVNATWAVLAIVLIVAIVLGVVDLIFTKLIKVIFA
jgi:preprotein translocase subunit SecE